MKTLLPKLILALDGASPFQTIATNRTGAFGVTTFTDTSATNAGPYF